MKKKLSKVNQKTISTRKSCKISSTGPKYGKMVINNGLITIMLNLIIQLRDTRRN